MSDVPPGAQALPVPAHTPFPLARMFYALGYALMAWLVFWALVALAVIQFAVLAINGRLNDELKGFSFRLVQYLWELFAFIAFVRDEKPFPFAPFPRHD